VHAHPGGFENYLKTSTSSLHKKCEVASPCPIYSVFNFAFPRSRFFPSRQHKFPPCIVGVWIFMEYVSMFKPYTYFHNRVEYTKNYNKNIFINLTVDPSSLEQIVIFPCDCLDFHEIGYRETMIKLVDNYMPFQYYVKGTLLSVYAVLWMRTSMHPQFLVINAVFQVEECAIILV
jgi:hypothetical protein